MPLQPYMYMYVYNVQCTVVYMTETLHTKKKKTITNYNSPKN